MTTTTLLSKVQTAIQLLAEVQQALTTQPSEASEPPSEGATKPSSEELVIGLVPIKAPGRNPLHHADSPFRDIHFVPCVFVRGPARRGVLHRFFRYILGA